jgi:hypothetical protein
MNSSRTTPRILTTIAIPLSEFERSVIVEMKRRGGFATLDEVVLAGLWQLARQLDVDVPYSAFGIGNRKG